MSWIWLLVFSDVMLTLISSDFIVPVFEIASDILISNFFSFSSSFFPISTRIKVVSDPLFCNAFVSKQHDYRLTLMVPLREKCSYSELFWSVFSRIWTEYRLEKLRIWTLFMQCPTWRNTGILFWIDWLLSCNWTLFSEFFLFIAAENRSTAELLMMFYSQVLGVEVCGVSFGSLWLCTIFLICSYWWYRCSKDNWNNVFYF